MNQMLKINNSLMIGMDEIQWKFSRSGGPGGQNVNKVETRVTLLFNVSESQYLTERQRKTILEKLRGMTDNNGVLQVNVNEERSQLRNREIALDRFREKLAWALKRRIPRKKTKVPKSVKEKRLRQKRYKSDLKRSRDRKNHMNDGY